MIRQQRAFYKNAFNLDENGHGGEKRSFQIHDLFSKNLELINVRELKNVFNPWYIRYWIGFKFLYRNKLLLKQFKNCSLVGFKVLNFVSWIKSNKDIELFIWEPNYSYDDYFIPLLCRAYDIKIIALPHNIESLVLHRKSAISGRISPSWFHEELTILKSCDVIFTISLEDQWLLSLYGLTVNYLEYMPSANVIQHCKTINKKRHKAKSNDSFLMLGTAHNTPTADGMRAVIDYVIEKKIQFNLIIAGYGTEDLVKEYKELPLNVKILGSVNIDDLSSLLVSCKALLVYQKNATGVLTKLQEFVLAGIPIIANNISLRSFHNINGLHNINSLEDLNNLQYIKLESPAKDDEAISRSYKKKLEAIAYSISNI